MWLNLRQERTWQAVAGQERYPKAGGSGGDAWKAGCAVPNPSAIDYIEQMPEHEPIEEAKEAVGMLVNGKAFRSDKLYGELLKLGLTEDSAISGSTVGVHFFF